MPNRTISTKLAIDGEAEYKKAISEINSGMKVLRSEMALAASDFETNANSVEALTKKGEILEREILTQREKVETIRAALQNAANNYGEADKRTMAWQTSLNQAQIELNKLNRELDANSEAYKKASEAADTYHVQFQETVSSLTEFDNSLSVLRSEMALVSAKYEENADSVEALTKKGEVLAKQHETQREKVLALTKALDQAVFLYGESSDEARKYQIALNNAQTDLIKSTHAINANNEAIQESVNAMQEASNATEEASSVAEEGQRKFNLFSGEAQGLGDVIDKLGGKFGVNLPSGIQESLNGLVKINPAAAAAAGGFTALVAAIAKTEDKLRDMALESAAYADEIMTNSMNTGLSEAALQEWEYASELIDVSSDTIRSSMSRLIRSMDSARDGSEDAAAAFEALHVGYINADGTLRDTEAVFYDIVDALGEIENGTERDATSMELFGKSAQDLNSLIVQGSGKLREYAAEAREMGYVLNEEDLEALGAVDDAQQRLLKTQEAVANQISAEYAPYMEEALTMSRDLLKEVGDALVQSGVVDSLGSIVVSVTSLLRPLAELGTSTLPILSTVLGGIAGFLALIADAANVVAGLLTWDFDRIGVAMGYGTSSGRSSNMQRWMGTGAAGAAASGSYYNPATGMYEGNYYHNAGGNDNFPGGWSWVGENGPEQVFLPAGSVIATAQEARGAGGGDTFYITIDAASVREFNDIVEMARNARRMERMGGGRV